MIAHRGGFPLRCVLSATLIVLLATCPIVCGTADAHAPVRGELGDAHGAPGHPGLPAPANDDDCLCNGALKAGESASDLGLDTQSQPSCDALASLALAVPRHELVDSPLHRSHLRTGDAAGGARSSILRC